MQEEVPIHLDVFIADLLEEKFSSMDVGISLDILKYWRVISEACGKTNPGYIGKRIYLTKIGKAIIFEVKKFISGKEIEIIRYEGFF